MPGNPLLPTKSRLSKLEQQKYLADLEDLQSEGADIEIPSQWLDDARALEVRVVSDGSTAVEGPAGSVFYTVRLRLTARRPHVILLDADLETDFDHDIVLESLRRANRLAGQNSSSGENRFIGLDTGNIRRTSS